MNGRKPRCRERGLIFGVCTAVLLAPGGSRLDAQTPPSLSGYLEHQFSTAHSEDGWSQLDYDRLRLDLRAEAGRRTRISAALVWQYYRGNTSVRLRDVLPDEFDAIVGSTSIAISDRHSLNHAYMALNLGPMEVVAGKQFLTWGAAMAFNPTELFRPKNLFEPSYEREGVAALSGKLPLGPLSDVLVAYVPEGSFETSGKVIRARHQIGLVGISAMAAEVWQDTAPSGFGVPAPSSRRRRVVGGDITGELLGMGLWGEATWSDAGGDGWVEATVGGNTTLGESTLVYLEGYYDSRGEWTEPYPLGLWLDRLAGNRRSIGRGMIFGGFSRPVGQLWTIGCNVLGNTGDRSFVVIPVATWAFAQDVDLVFNGAVPVGREGTEFGVGQTGGFLRARVYF